MNPGNPSGSKTNAGLSTRRLRTFNARFSASPARVCSCARGPRPRARGTTRRWRNVKPRPYSTEPEDVFAKLAEHVHTLYNILNSREGQLRITLQDAHWTTLKSARCSKSACTNDTAILGQAQHIGPGFTSSGSQRFSPFGKPGRQSVALSGQYV